MTSLTFPSSCAFHLPHTTVSITSGQSLFFFSDFFLSFSISPSSRPTSYQIEGCLEISTRVCTYVYIDESTFFFKAHLNEPLYSVGLSLFLWFFVFMHFSLWFVSSLYPPHSCSSLFPHLLFPLLRSIFLSIFLSLSLPLLSFFHFAFFLSFFPQSFCLDIVLYLS